MNTDVLNLNVVHEKSLLVSVFKHIKEKKQRVMMWGGGGLGKALLDLVYQAGIAPQFIGIVDSDSDMWGTSIRGKTVYKPDQILSIKPDAVLISTSAEEDVAIQLKHLGYMPDDVYRSSGFLREISGLEINSHVFRRWNTIENIQGACVNFLKYMANFELKADIIDNTPFYLIAEPTTKCNLQCFLCGGSKRAVRPFEMSFQHFKTIIDAIGKNLFYIQPFKGGESLVHGRFVDMLEYAREKTGAYMALSSNFSFDLCDFDLQKILSSCDQIGVCLDGLSQESYEVYRVKGKFDRVYRNLRRLAELSRDMDEKPEILWRFIVFRHNEHDVDEARDIAENLGVKIQFVKPQVLDKEWLPENKEFWRDEYLGKPSEDTSQNPAESPYETCNWLYGSLVVNADLTLVPCCEWWPNWWHFGLFDGQDFSTSFNNASFQKARVRNAGEAKKNGSVSKCLNCYPYMRSREEDMFKHGENIQAFILKHIMLGNLDFEHCFSRVQAEALLTSSNILEGIKHRISHSASC